jgi:hypothetical protein
MCLIFLKVTVCAKVSARALLTTVILPAIITVFVTIKPKHANAMTVLDITQQDTGVNCVSRSNVLALDNLVVVMEYVYMENVAVMRAGQLIQHHAMCQTALAHQIVVVKVHVMPVGKALDVNVTKDTWAGNVSMNVYTVHHRKTTHVCVIPVILGQLVNRFVAIMGNVKMGHVSVIQDIGVHVY